MSKIHELYQLVLDRKLERKEFLAYLDTATDINEPDEKNRTILFHVIEAGDFEVAEKILQKGATVKAPDLLHSPTFFAVFAAYKPKSEIQDTSLYSTSHDILPLLLKAGCDINETTNQGATLLYFAMLKDDLLRATLVLNSGANLFVKDKSDCTVFMNAIEDNGDAPKIEMIKLLLEYGTGVTADFSMMREFPTDEFPAETFKNVILIGAVKNGEPITPTIKGFESAIFSVKQFQAAVDRGEPFNYVGLYRTVLRLIASGNTNAELVEFSKVLKPLAHRAEQTEQLKRLVAKKIGFFEGKVTALSPEKIRELPLDLRILIREMQSKPTLGK